MDQHKSHPAASRREASEKKEGKKKRWTRHSNQNTEKII
jgi:hypothetical protein